MGNERTTETWTWVIGFAVGAAILALLVAAYSIGFNRGQGEAGTGPEQAAEQPAEEPADGSSEEPQPDESAPSEAGKQAFIQSCGSCHILSAAGTSGTIGPNLDQLKPDGARTLKAIEKGGTGTGAMPSNIVSGKEAEEVADFVAAAVGR